MIPQSTFMVLATIVPQREADLRRLLASMNDAPGRVNANNAMVPFAKLDTVHVARMLIVDDKTVDDIRVYGLTPPAFPLYFAFLGDIDGDADAFLQEVARVGATGLRALFSCCQSFDSTTDLLAWMRAHSVAPAATYVNWRGRTVRRVREEAALRDSLDRYVRANAASLAGVTPGEARATLRQHVRDETTAGRLTLSPDPPTPVGWWINNLLHLIGVPAALVLVSPVLIPVVIVTLLRLRGLEKTDPELCPRVDQTHSDELALLEDHDVSNQFTAMGSLKPGIARRWMAISAFFLIDYAARHLFTHGGLGRVRTIHFARWVFLDDQKRAVFMSNYDGSLESYMDDFINKVGFGLNVAFSGGIGYPTTRWLLLDGCADERKFKDYLRRHQVPTQVWYKAYPGLTAVDLERNGLIRQGLDAPAMSDDDVGNWLALL
jgi:hypothetical protein